MKKLLVFLVIVAIGVGVWYFFFQPEAEEVVEEEIVVEEEAAEEVVEVNLITGEEVPAPSDIGILEGIRDNVDATIEDCEEMEDEELVKSCQQDFLYQEALDSGDPEKCHELEGESVQESCLMDLDPSLY